MKEKSYVLTKLAGQCSTVPVTVVLHLQGLPDSLDKTLRVIEKRSEPRNHSTTLSLIYMQIELKLTLLSINSSLFC